MITELKPEEGIAGKFVKTAFDENGVLSKIEFTNDETFNFAFDVVDALAEKTPDKTALIYVSRDKEEKKFTFKEIKEYSNMAANYYKSLGIKKGDRVLLVLKRHYQFWFTILALHKIGAVAIPATNILKVEDYRYRIEAANVKAVICTADDKIPDAMAAIDPDDKVIKVIVNGEREHFHPFDKDILSFSKEFARPTGKDTVYAHDTMIIMFTSGTTKHPKMVAHNHLYEIGRAHV